MWLSQGMAAEPLQHDDDVGHWSLRSNYYSLVLGEAAQHE